MTANDSKSTPKKAEDATRHPLALLADYIEAVHRHLDADSYSGALEEAMNDADDALLIFDPAALRAQAEAEAGLREALVRVEHLSAKAIADDVEGYYTNEMGRIARAALAQAGGES